MTRHSYRKLISLMVALATLFSCITINASAAENTFGAAEYSVEALSQLEITQEQIPEVIDDDIIDANKNVRRLYDQETDLNSVLFINSDGSKTLYSFEYPIKYVDATGSIQDKSNELFPIGSATSVYAYVNSRNDINTYFPNQLSSNHGVKLDAKMGDIILAPDSTSVCSVDTNSQNSSVIYEQPFGEFTRLRYTPTFTGFKEDLILEQNVGNQFSFIISTSDYHVSKEGGQVVFTSLTGDETIVMEPVYVYDSFVGVPQEYTDNYAHNTWNNIIDVDELSDGQYKLTISVDQSFLADARTVYPVYIDPSFNVTTSGSGTSKTIQDVPLYNGADAKALASGGNAYNLLGYVGSVSGADYGVGRMLMKFPGLTSNETYKKLPASAISNVTLYAYESSGNSQTATIYAYQYTGSTWTESSANYNNTSWSGYTSPSANVSIGSTGQATAAFNITNIVKGWKNNSTYESKGILLKNANESNSAYRKDFRSTESSATPYISVTYTTVSKSVRILYDSSCSYTASQLNSYFSTAVEAFSSEFFIDFNRAYTSSSTLLNGASCPNTETTALCTAACGALSNCDTMHHKGSGRLLDVATSTSYYTYRLVGHRLCYYDEDEGTHSGVVGLGYRPGKDAITSVYSSTNIARSIQHELTHNLGGSHSTCNSNQRCVLQGDMDYWCDTCRANILANR